MNTTIFDYFDKPVLLLSEELTVEYANTAMQPLADHKTGEHISKYFFPFSHDDFSMMKMQITGNNRIERYVLTSVKNNQNYTMSASIGQYDDKTRHILCIFETADIADRKISLEKSKDYDLLVRVFRISYRVTNLDHILVSILALLGGYFGLSRTYIYEISDDGGFFYNSYEWCAVNIRPLKQNAAKIETKACAKWISLLQGKGQLSVSKLSEVTDDGLMSFCNERDVKSLACVALYFNGRFSGFVGFEKCSAQRLWGEYEMRTLRAVCQHVSDIIVRRNAIEMMKQSNTVLQAIFNSMEERIVVTDIESGAVLFANERAKKFCTVDTPNPDYWQMLHNGEEFEKARAAIEEIKDKGRRPGDSAGYECEKTVNGTSQKRWFLSQLVVIPWTGGANALLETVIDITERRRNEEHLEKLASFDGLTGLFMRSYGMERLEETIAASRSSEENVTLCYMDLDNLKTVNDTYGHTQGDTYLKVIADTLKQCMRSSDMLIRMGGDEYLAVFPNCSKEDVLRVVGQFNDELARINASGRHRYTLSVSIGITEVHPGCTMTVDDIIDAADKAMYENKIGNRARSR